MNREDRLDLMLLYAAGALDPEETQAVRAALDAGDPDAVAALDRAREILAQLPEALPPRLAPASIQARLNERIADQTTGVSRPDAQPPPWGLRLAGWMAAAAVLALAVGVAWGLLSAQAQRHDRELAALERQILELDTDLRVAEQQAAAARQILEAARREADDRARRIASLSEENRTLAQTAEQRAGRLAEAETGRGLLANQLEQARQTLAALATPTGRAVILPGTEDQPRAGARLIYDPPQNQALIFAHDVGPPPAGQTYQLWVVTEDGRTVSVGTFVPDAQGNVAARFELPRDPGPVQLAAVTNEPEGGSPQPTGQFQLLGEF
ncbi:MAG: anti-sigma factor [Planctomycetota bacterium]